MSFLLTLFQTINPVMCVQANDILFIIVLSFYLGRLYQRNKSHAVMPLLVNAPIPALWSESVPVTHDQANLEEQQEDLESLEVLQRQVSLLPQRMKSREHRNSVQIVQNNILQSNFQPAHLLKAYDDKNMSPKEIVRNDTGKQLNSNQTQNKINPQKQWLKEKIKLDGHKIQQKGKFELFFQKNSENIGLIRKIQKHEIITDYILNKQTFNLSQSQLIPTKKEVLMPSENSVVEVEYYQDYSLENSVPIVEKRIIQLNQKSQFLVNSFIEHGKFRKLYRSILKIGQGGFGTVYQAYNMLECKKYAIKKIYISKSSKQIQNLLGEIKILNSLAHPNIVKYNSCWLQYAEFNEHKEYQRLLEKYHRTTDKNERQSSNSDNEMNQEEFEQSYMSSKNSGISFLRSSKQLTKKQSSVLKMKENLLSSKASHSNRQEGNQQASYGLLPVMYIQMELCEHSLSHYLRKRQQVDRVFAFQIIHQIINGVIYIHSNHIIHRDLKPGNILFAETNGNIALKIGDFGLAIHVQQQGKKLDSLMIPNTRAGTPSYIAPELYLPSIKRLSEDDLQRTDIYSLAVIYYEMLNKFSTSHERDEKLALLKQGKIAGLHEYKEQRKLIQELIRNNRPKAKDILTGQSWKKLSQAISKAKRKVFYTRVIQKKDSQSTNNTSLMGVSQQILPSVDLSRSAQPSKKQKTKSKNRIKSKIKVEGYDGKKSRIYEASQASPIEADNDEEENEVQHPFNSTIDPTQQELEKDQLFQHNIKLIKRISSSLGPVQQQVK